MEDSTDLVQKEWGASETTGFGCCLGLIFVVAQTLVLIAFAVVRISSNSDLAVQRVMEELSENGLVLAVATIVGSIIVLALMFPVVQRRSGRPAAELLALKPLGRKTYLSLVVLALGIIAVIDGLSLILDRPIVPEFMANAYRTAGWPPLLWLAIIVAAPVVEEIFFRGLLFEGLSRSRIGAGGAVAVTALVWALIHLQYDLYDITIIFLLGIVLGIVRHRTGSVLGCILIHAVVNLVATIEAALLAG